MRQPPPGGCSAEMCPAAPPASAQGRSWDSHLGRHRTTALLVLLARLAGACSQQIGMCRSAPAAESARSGGFGFTDNWELPATWLSYAQGSVSSHSGPQPQHRHIVSHVTDTRKKYEMHKLTEDVTVHTCACMLSCKHNQHVSCVLANLSFENSIIT